MREALAGLALLFVFGACSAQPKNIFADTGEEKFELENVGMLVRAGWSNMGSWFFLYDPSKINSVNESGEVMIMSFDGEYENLGAGGSKAYLVENFIKLVNDKADTGIKLTRLTNDGDRIELEYQDGRVIMWDYANKEPPIENNRSAISRKSHAPGIKK